MITPHPFQMTAADNVVAAIRHGAHVVVVQSATGSGKTTIGCELIRRALAKPLVRILEIVHRRKLVDQFSERLIDFHIDHGIIMRGHHLEPDCRVQVASRDTLLSRNDFEMPEADLVIVDEGRHAASPEFRKLLTKYRNKYIVLLDATPVMSDGRGLGPWAEALIVAAKTTDLVRDGYLVPVKCFAPDHASRGKRRRRGIAGDLVESWKQYAEDSPTVLFCSRISHSLDAVAAYNANGITAAHVDANTDDDERDRIFDGLGDGTYKVVSNVGIIKEGVDIPCLRCCQIYMDMRGRVSFLQAVGRIMRPSAGKPYGILIDHAGAVFHHGFPDEDTEWTLEGNVDENFEKNHNAKNVHWCASCELMYRNQLECPQCGKMPSKPPRSIFAPPPVDATNEVLVEAERNGQVVTAARREEMIAHWFRCLSVAVKRNGPFTMASAIFKQRYGCYPPDEFPMMPGWEDRRRKVSDLYPDFGKKKVRQ